MPTPEGEERVGLELLAAEEDDEVLEPDATDLGDGGIVEVGEVDAGDHRADCARERLDLQGVELRGGSCAHRTLIGTVL